MILSNTTKEKIMDVRDYYDKRDQLVDINFMDDILAIIQKEDAFQGKLDYEFIEKRAIHPAYTENGKAYFNMDLVMKFIKGKVKYGFSQYPKENMTKYYNFMAQIVMLHECSHVWQQKGLENYAEINRLNGNVMGPRRFPLREIIKVLRVQIKLLKSEVHFYFERQANVDAFRELVEMYQGYEFLEFIELNHIYNLSFKPQGESIVHDTLKALLLEYDYNCDGIPQDLLFEVGLPTNREYALAVNEAINKYDNDELSYKRVMEKIKNY